MITVERAKEVLHYDPETGIFRWLVDVWGGRYHNVCVIRAGDVAGTKNGTGYYYITADGYRMRAHRLAWLMVYGRMPKALIDHIDGDKTNNRISNLREATKSQNGFNRGPERGNVSGFKGVYWCSQKRKWQAEMRVRGKRKHLGFHDTPEGAAEANAAAAVVEHGEFAWPGMVKGGTE